MTSTEWADVCAWISDRWPRYAKDWAPDRAARLFEDFAQFDNADVWRVVQGIYEAGERSIGSSDVYGRLKAHARKAMTDEGRNIEYCKRKGEHTFGTTIDEATRQAQENHGRVTLYCSVCLSTVIKPVGVVFDEWGYGPVPAELKGPEQIEALTEESDRIVP